MNAHIEAARLAQAKKDLQVVTDARCKEELIHTLHWVYKRIRDETGKEPNTYLKELLATHVGAAIQTGARIAMDTGAFPAPMFWLED